MQIQKDGTRKENNVEIIAVNDLLKAHEVSQKNGWQSSWSNYSLIAPLFFPAMRDACLKLLSFFWWELWRDGRRSGQSHQETQPRLETIHTGFDTFKLDSSLLSITFLFFPVINCNNTQWRWRVEWAGRDLMRPKMLHFSAANARQSLLLHFLFMVFIPT